MHKLHIHAGSEERPALDLCTSTEPLRRIRQQRLFESSHHSTAGYFFHRYMPTIVSTSVEAASFIALQVHLWRCARATCMRLLSYLPPHFVHIDSRRFGARLAAPKVDMRYSHVHSSACGCSSEPSRTNNAPAEAYTPSVLNTQPRCAALNFSMQSHRITLTTAKCVKPLSLFALITG